MKWLALAFFVSAAYLPIDNARIGLTFTPDLETKTYVEYGFKLKAFDLIYFSASDRSYQTPSENKPYWKPFREDYKVALGIETKYLDFGIRHECDHEVISWAFNQGGFASNRTELYATLHAEVSF